MPNLFMPRCEDLNRNEQKSHIEEEAGFNPFTPKFKKYILPTFYW